MTGEELYRMFQRNLEKQGVESDDWVELDGTDKKAWDATAEQLLEG